MPAEFPPQISNLDPDRFLARYWQREPLLIRQAFPGLVSPLSAEELAGLALEPEIESRLVRQTGTAPGWELRHGPFTEEDITTLPSSHWTLLLQDIEKHLPRLAGIIEHFRFIPDWRIDDLMISYAAPGGSVGPHRDNYDVFLLQAAGHRRWRLDRRQPVNVRERDDLPLRLLDDFTATDEWLLAPGDMLYLPPRVPHHGVAEDHCQTWSIGFRAPRVQELLADMVEHLLARVDAGRYLDDAGRSPASHPALIDGDTLDKVRRIMRNALDTDDGEIDRCFAAHVTEPKPAFADKNRARPLDRRDLRRRLNAGVDLMRNPASRLALLETSRGLLLYADGEPRAVSAALQELVYALTAQSPAPAAMLSKLMTCADSEEFLCELVNAGHWFFADEAEDAG